MGLYDLCNRLDYLITKWMPKKIIRRLKIIKVKIQQNKGILFFKFGIRFTVSNERPMQSSELCVQLTHKYTLLPHAGKRVSGGLFPCLRGLLFKIFCYFFDAFNIINLININKLKILIYLFQ